MIVVTNGQDVQNANISKAMILNEKERGYKVD